MKIIKPSFEILAFPESLDIIEKAGRTCYQSEPKGEPEKFIKNKIVDSGHHSVIEHLLITVRIITDRGVLAELTRHRLASFSVESSRYCNYSKDKFGGEITFIKPCFWDVETTAPEKWSNGLKSKYQLWIDAMRNAEFYYMHLMANGATPQEARSVLPNSLKTEIIMSANFREWLHIFKLRCNKKSHSQMRKIIIPLKKEFAKRLPVIFG